MPVYKSYPDTVPAPPQTFKEAAQFAAILRRDGYRGANVPAARQRLALAELIIAAGLAADVIEPPQRGAAFKLAMALLGGRRRWIASVSMPTRMQAMPRQPKPPGTPYLTVAEFDARVTARGLKPSPALAAARDVLTRGIRPMHAARERGAVPTAVYRQVYRIAGVEPGMAVWEP